MPGPPRSKEAISDGSLPCYMAGRSSRQRTRCERLLWRSIEAKNERVVATRGNRHGAAPYLGRQREDRPTRKARKGIDQREARSTRGRRQRIAWHYAGYLGVCGESSSGARGPLRPTAKIKLGHSPKARRNASDGGGNAADGARRGWGGRPLEGRGMGRISIGGLRSGDVAPENPRRDRDPAEGLRRCPAIDGDEAGGRVADAAPGGAKGFVGVLRQGSSTRLRAPVGSILYKNGGFSALTASTIRGNDFMKYPNFRHVSSWAPHKQNAATECCLIARASTSIL